MTSLYTGFYLFAVGEVTPRAESELVLAIISLMLSSILNGVLIGNMALFMNELQKK